MILNVNNNNNNIDKLINKINYEKINDQIYEDKFQFNKLLNKSFSEFEKLQYEAENKVESYLMGKEIDIHNVMVSMEKLDITFRLMNQVRNKIIEAYKEIYQMQI